MVDSQEFKDILDLPQNTDTFAGDYNNATTYYPGQVIKYNGQLYNVTDQVTGVNPPNDLYFQAVSSTETLGFLMSSYSKELELNNAVIAEAEINTNSSGYDTRNFYTLQVDDKGNVDLITVDRNDIAIDDVDTVDAQFNNPVKEGYSGYLLGDGIPPNGVPYGFGLKFPEFSAQGDYFLRTDYLPNRLFRFDGKRWIKFEDKVRTNLTNTDTKNTQKASFINNTNKSNINALYTDTFKIENPKTFRTTDPTLSINVSTNTVVTKIDYNESYGVEVFVGEESMPLTTTFSSSGKLAFTTTFNLTIGSMLRWTIYGQKISQRVALSKALRPRADL
jgi:hypothetical protein